MNFKPEVVTLPASDVNRAETIDVAQLFARLAVGI